MAYRQQDEETICAVSTPPGVGGIGVIRVSGPSALVCTRILAPKLSKNIESHKVYLASLVNNNNEPIDEVVITYFEKGRSYTGDETIEISYHGSPVVGRQILHCLQNSGIRHADPGEFTYRAFMHGNIDLAQAESVLALIESRSEASARQAIRNLKGQFSGTIIEIEQELTLVLANLEANLDFSEESLEVESRKSLQTKMQFCLEKIEQLKSSYDKGRLLREGLRVVIYGEPNVGKSSLINFLLGEDRAIVSDRPGTTRDVIEAETMFANNRVQLVDTAGVHETSDELELQGIKRSHSEAEQADLILHILDATNVDTNKLDKNSNVLNVYNKVDLVDNFTAPKDCIAISVATGEGLENLQQAIHNVCEEQVDFSSVTAFQARHFELLQKASEDLQKGIELLIENNSPEFVISEVQFSLYALFEILGKRFDDEVMDRVFKEFCIGK